MSQFVSNGPRATALVVVDVQESFRHRPYFEQADVARYLSAQNRLVAGFVAAGLPVVRVLHVEPEGAFSLASGLVVSMQGLAPFEPATTLHKHAHSAFAGTDLSRWLLERGITRIAVSGIRTEQCCETTTRDGSDRGFEVDFVAEATLTFPMTHAGGRTYSAAEIRERTELVLAGRFATIVGAEEAIERAASRWQGVTRHAQAA